MNVGDQVRAKDTAGFYGGRRGEITKVNLSGGVMYDYLVRIGNDNLGFNENELDLIEPASVAEVDKSDTPLTDLRDAVKAARRAGYYVTCKVSKQFDF